MAKKKEKSAKQAAVAITSDQNTAFINRVKELKQKENQVQGSNIKLMYLRGNAANTILTKPNVYGQRSLDDIAANFNCKKQSIKLSMRLASKMTVEEIETLAKSDNPPSIRMMNLIMSIKDEDKQNKAIEALKEGNLTNDKFPDQLDELTGRTAKKSRKPAKLTAALAKFIRTADKAVEQICWLDGIGDKVNSIDNAEVKQNTITISTDVLTKLEELKAAIDARIDQVKAVVEAE